MSTYVAPDVEKMARAIVETFGGNPDMPVQAGAPQVYGTPAGECFAVAPGAHIPLWRQYIHAAQKMLTVSRSIPVPSIDLDGAAA